MGQYHLVANLTRKEFIHTLKLRGDGLKLLEQLNSTDGTMAAFIPSPRLLKR